MLYHDGKGGFLTTIIGPMFSEKSGELIKRCLLSEKYQNKHIVVLKPALDDRFGVDEVVSRIGLRIGAHPIERNVCWDNFSATLQKELSEADMVAIDEAQFFSEGIVEVVLTLLEWEKEVIVAGLNLDYLGKPFGHINDLLLYSDEIIQKTAYCRCCGRPAMFTQRLLGGKPFTASDMENGNILIGDSEAYEPRCRLCYVTESRKVSISSVV